MKTHQIAQINIAQAVDTMESETMKGFVDRLDEINALADRSPGFVWRLQTDEGDATSIQAFDDPFLIVNMSVWEDIESLKNFALKTAHTEYLKRRFEWFERMKEAYAVMWWVSAGHQPHVLEAKARLNFLRKYGDTQKAFSFKKIFPPG